MKSNIQVKLFFKKEKKMPLALNQYQLIHPYPRIISLIMPQKAQH